MNCQKCRTPLKLDTSLQDLNSAAFDLLVGSTGNSVDPNTAPSRPPYPQDRKDLYNRVSQDAVSPIFKRTIPSARPGLGPQAAMAASTQAGLKDNPAMSFVMLTDSQVTLPQPSTNGSKESRSKRKPQRNSASPADPSGDSRQSLSLQIESTTRLFEILSSRSDIDHPICTECTDLLLSSLQSRLSASTKERDAYISFVKKLNNTIPTQLEVSKAQSDLAAAKSAEARAFADLQALEREKASLDEEIDTLEAESRALDLEEEAFWRARNAFALTLSSFQNDRDALNAAYDHDAQQLERLQRTNVYNDTFCIGHDGNFATINGLRLGRLPPQQNVDWAEINAAWGTASLLLATVAEKLGFSFRGYRIKPMGSTSKIERIEYPPSPAQSSGTAPPTSASQPKITSLDLFSSGDLPLARMILHRRIDAGMVAFLECLRQLGEFVQNGTDPSSASNSASPSNASGQAREIGGDGGGGGGGGLKLPYKIRKDLIENISIKLGSTNDETWTQACKYTLTCCKFLLAHASNVGGPGSAVRRGTG